MSVEVQLQQPRLTPSPLDLVDIPLVRSTTKLERPGADGTLPAHAHRLSHTWIGPDGASHTVHVKGDAQLGLPYGHDWDVLLALFRILDERRLPDGLIPDPSLRMIGDAMGLRMDGDLARRIRAALERFAHVRIQSRLVRRVEDRAEAIARGAAGAHPVAPATAHGPRTEEEEVLWLLEYRWRTEYDRRAQGEDWIDHLRVNPVWTGQAVAGWAVWINPHVFGALERPIGKRLYQICAAQAARGVRAPWSFDLETLRSLCAMAEGRKAARVRDSLLESASELQAAEVIAGVECESPTRGTYVLTFTPGRHLDATRAMRGAGMLDLHPTRARLQRLAAFGIAGPAARKLVLDHSDAVDRVLCYVTFLRERHPERIQKSWSGYVMEAVQQGWSWDGDTEFQGWMRAREEPGTRAGTSVDGGTSAPAPSVRVPSPSPATIARTAPPPVPPSLVCAAEPLDPAVLPLMALLREVAATELPPLCVTALAHFAPHRVEGDTLVCRASIDLYARWSHKYAAEIGALLEACTAGACRALTVEMVPR